MSFRAKCSALLALGALAILVATAWFAALAIAVAFGVASLASPIDYRVGDVLLLVVPFALGVLAALAYIAYARSRVRRAEGDALKERRLLIVLAAVPLFVLAGLAANWIAILERKERGAAFVAAEADREAALAQFLQQRFVLQDVTVSPSNGLLQASARLSGERPGRYRLEWQVLDGNYKRTLLSGSEMLDLPGPRSFSTSFSRRDLEQAYRDKVLAGRGGAMVDEDFTFELALVPDLDQAELERLPRRIAALGPDRELAASGSASFPVRFVIPN